MATQRSFITLDLTLGQVENLNPQGQAETGINTGVTLNTADTGITLSSGGVIKGGQTAFDSGNGFFLGYTGSQYKVSIGDSTGENLTWDGTNLDISARNSDFSGDLTVSGNLTVTGTTTTLDTTTLQVEDNNIVLNYGSADTSATANGSGITIQDATSAADATILWNATNDEFDFNFGIDVDGNITVSGTVDGRDIATDGSKLDGIEAGATGDQTAAEIRTLVESATDSNVFTDADHTKLNGIEANADVTDTANVTAAGALMDSEVTNLAQVKSFDSADYATAAQGTKADTAHGWGDHSTEGYLTEVLADVSDTAPSSPSNGALWFDSTNLALYVYYNDGDSSQWVQV